jgi:hypothetical protein
VVAPGAASADAFLPKSLHDAAAGHAGDTFSVIVQGTPGVSTTGVAGDVHSQERSHPGDEDGISRRFASIGSVAAELTGRQIIALSHANGIRAITPDAPLVASDVNPPVNVVAPAASGVAQQDQTLSALNGEWTGGVAPLSFAYQWLRCTGGACTPIAGATSETYVATADDVGSSLAVDVTATDAVGATGDAVSAASDVVQAPPAPAPAPLAPPTSVTPPAVSGTATSGETLVATEGVWASSGPLTYTWQWQRCSAVADACADVAGATEATYLLSDADVGSTLRVVVTATDTTGSGSASSIASSVVAPAAPPPPPPPSLPLPVAPVTNVAAPTVSGIAQDGGSLAATDGAWSGGVAPLSFTYQWLRCDANGAACAAIDGATSSLYPVVTADVGSTLAITVTATDSTGAATSATSLVSAPVTAAAAPQPTPPMDVMPPTISGSPQQGAALSADAGTWSGDAPIDYTYAWQRCDAAGDGCTAIAGADAPTYTPSADDATATLRVSVTATNGAGSASAVSAATTPVLSGPPVNVEPPVLSTSPVAGAPLLAPNGSWTSATPPQYTYQWQRCDPTGASCADIAGATFVSYAPTMDDVGSTLRVVVTASNIGGSTSAVSPVSDRVRPQTASGFWNWQLWPYAVHADSLWDSTSRDGATAPTIAVVDSGVDSSLPGLDGVVTQQVTLTSLTQSAAADGYGHGSFVAQVAAGRAPGDAGAAPTAHVVSLDVMDDNGMAMTSDVIAAADWIYSHKDTDGIRVANFSLLGSSPSSFQYDPLDRALEKLWLSGVVVVTAAGNFAVDGAASDVPYAPANDPFTIAVGAADTAGTVSPVDDFAAPWSAYGHTLDGFAKPDLGAPGRYMVEQVPTGSTLYTTRPDRIVAPGELQLSGTSFAAPVVSGLAADLLAAHPDWTPDQVKGALMLSAVQPGQSAPFALGVGEVDGGAAAAVADPPNPNAALDQFLVPDPAGGPTPVFDAASWGTAVQADASWGTASWGTASWGTASWGTASWGTTYWDSASWGTASWGTASWGTSATPADNAGDDFLPAGAYWMSWSSG